MRIILIPIGLVLLLAVAGLYVLLPRQVGLSQQAPVKAPAATVLRALTEKEKWQQWWPDSLDGLHYRDENFTAGAQMNASLLVDLPAGDTTVRGLLMVIGIGPDSTLVSWEATLPAGANPVHRAGTWIESRSLNREMAEVLARLEAFVEKPKNVYGLAVKEVKVTTPYLVAVRGQSTGYPTTGDVYTQVAKLRAYIQAEGARETAPPMLNVERLDSARYGYMVALPVDRPLPGRGDILEKRMVLGKLLQAEVRGGDYVVRCGLAALEAYRQDYRRISPAIPYTSLVTDRSREPDTAKWITQLYYPVF